MSASEAYIAVAVAALAVIVLVLVLAAGGRLPRREFRLTPLGGLSLAFVLASVTLSDDRLIGYSLIGVGVLLALADIVRRHRVTSGR